MTNVLVKKIFLLVFMLIMMGMASAQSISYQGYYDLSLGASLISNQSISSEETGPTDIYFSNDGLTVFTLGVGADQVNQYSIASAYDISGGLTHQGSYTIDESNPFSLNFNSDGSKMYVLGISADRIYQYSLSTNFDITSTVTLDGSYYVGLGSPYSFTFNSDGTKIYVGTTSGHMIHSYSLSIAYDVTSTVTYLNSSDALANSVFDFQFIKDGKELIILNTTDGIQRFNLGIAYDITSSFTQIGETYSVLSHENNSYGIYFTESGNRFFIVGTTGDDINQFELGHPEYDEAISNNGSLPLSYDAFYLTGETFVNSGSELIYNTDYQISNLPAGLTPLLEISDNGQYGSLSFSGTATNHQDTDDVNDLIFTFNNSAFIGGDASSVTNAVSANSGISLDFRNNSTPIVAYGTLPNAAGATVNSSTFDVSSEDLTPEGLTFNSDGTKVFVVGSNGDAVYEYNLSNPYDITSGVTYSNNSHAVGTEDFWPTGVRFSTDGLKMFVSGRQSNEINQYSLSSAFDLSSTITHQGVFDVSNEASIANDLAFSPDGRTMMVCGPDIYQYSLANPFDITSGVAYVDFFDQVYTILSIDFGPDGTQILYTNSLRTMGIYDLEIPYDLTGDVSGGGGLSVLPQDNTPAGVAYSPDRKKLFMVGSNNDQINQYAISPYKFEESFNDNGSIIGTIQLRVIDDQFANANATLTQGVHYTVAGLPSGLSSSLEVSSDGLTADLTISGTTPDDLPADNVSNLEFTFNNTAFVNSNAADVINAVSADSYFQIDFKDLDGQIFSSDAYQLTGLIFDNNPISVSNETGSPYGIIFNNDGTKMYLGGGNEGTIIQYALTTPYDVSTASPEGTPLDVSAEETIPAGIAFSNDGTKLFLIGIINDKLHQYSLGTPYDINGTVTHDGDLAFTNGIGVTFSSDGSRMFLTSSSLIYQYALNTPFDITAGASQVASASTGSANSYSPTFSPDGKELFIMGGSHKVIYRYPLSNAFDITEGITFSESFGVTSQDTAPLSMTFSGDGKTVYVTGGIGDDINVYELPGIGFTEVSANSGALDGTYALNLIGDSFVNADGNLSSGTHYTETGLPEGLSSSMSISSDGNTATFSITGNADNHQNIDDATIDLNISFLNAAFSSGDASSISNNSFSISTDLDFDDNGSLSYSSGIFYEDFSNDGSIMGSMTVTITNETFSKTGLLTHGVDYNLTGIPSGHTPELLVAGNKLSATLTLTGAADNHQSSDNLEDLIISFENSAFTSTEAQYVFNASSENIGSISFDDNIPTITFGNQFDLSSDDPIQKASFSVADQDIDAGSMAFSNDGLKMFYVGYENDMIFEYHLTNAFDISSGVTYSGNSYDVSGETGSPSDLVFTPDGTTMFIMDGSGDEVEQYSLLNAFDIASTITHEGAFDVGSQDNQPAAITFSPNGRKMYMIGSSNDKIFQYTLSIPFDVTSEVSYDGVEATVTSRNYTDIHISDDGKKIFVSNSSSPGSSNITQYDLNTPFDIAGGISNSGSFYFHDIDYGPTDFIVSPDRKTLLVLGAQNDLVYQFDLTIDGFSEVGLNNGEVDGSLYFEIIDEQFSNAGGNFTHGSEYTINNLPGGLIPSVSVAADGQSATLTLSGSSDAHQDINDVELEFSFTDAAFVNSLASEVQNATNKNSTRSIDFRDNNPALSFGNTLDMDFATSAGSPLDVSSYSDYTSGIVFSNDGMKMFISFYGLGTVYEYALNNPYDLAVASQVASYDHSAEDMYAEDLAFSADGMKMFVLGSDLYTIYQYDLTTSFDISSGVSYSSKSFNHEDFDTSVYGFTFNADGSKLYIGGANENAVFQFSLSTPYDLSSVSYDGSPFDIVSVSPTGMAFSADGRYLLMTEDNDYQTIRYRLYVPYDVTQGGEVEETFDLDALSIWPSALGVSPDGSRVFISDGDNYAIHQYNIDLGDFTEAVANDGTVEGSANIYLIDDEFSNAGGTLAHGSDYVINNLPSGLTPTLSVEADGYSAVLSMSGVVSDHGNSDDIASLQFTFNNSAFSNYAAVDVDNSSAYNAGFGIDFSPYTENDITSFTFSEVEGSATVNNTAHTVVAEAVAGTDISAITPSIGISQNAEISPETGVEQDFSTAITYTVTAEDGTPQDWDVTITEETVAPTDIVLSGTSLDENSPAGTIVGTLSAIDTNFGETFTFFMVAELGNDDWRSFDIDGDNLVTTDFITLDFENKSSFTFELEVRDSENEVYYEDVTITLNDLNEAPTNILLSNTSVDESNPSGTFVGTLSPVDEDSGDSHTYSLKEGNVDNASFGISNTDLITITELDFETQSVYNLEIIVTDQEGLTFEQEFAISVNDLPAQITSMELSNSSVDENVAVGNVIGSFTTFGEDLSGSFIYDLVAGSGSDDNASFNISSDQLLVNSSLDFETQDSYSIRVMVVDGSLTFEKAFTITVNDVSEAPTDLTLNFNSITENNQVGDVIGTMLTTDEDAGESFTYSLVSGDGDTNNTSFSIVGNELQAAEVFDFETQDSYSVRIETNDGNTGTFSKSFTISITNENETIIVSNPITDQDLDEGFASFEIDLSGVFTDQDGDALTYEVSSSDETIVTVSNSGAILTMTEVGNFGPSTVTVTADDGSGITTSDEFIVTVSNVNDAPVVENAISDQDLNEGFGSLEIELSNTFTDEDGDALSLEASSGDETVVTVSITGTTLILIEVGNGTATVTVTANDGNGGSVSDDLIVTVNNVNDAPVVVNAIVDQTQDEGFGSVELDLSATFSDEDGDNLTLSVSSSDETVSTASLSGSILTLTEVGNGSTTITVTANDGNGGSVSDEFVITVNNVNDAPVVINPLNDQTDLGEGFGAAQINYSDVFEDPDGDALTISVSSSDESVVTVEVVSKDQIQINEVGVGTATITLIADDGNGESVSDKFIVTVSEAPNNAPIVVNPLGDQTDLVEGFDAAQINYSDVFEDPDGDALTVSVNSNDESVVTVEVIANDQIQINEVGVGTSTITLTADDGNGGSVSDEFIVTVTEALSNETDILEFSEPTQTEPAVIDAINHTVSITIQPTSDLIEFNPTIILSEGATYELMNAFNGLDDLIYTVTAEDGLATQDWIVTVIVDFSSTNGLEDEIDLQIYPNPTTDFLKVNTSETITAEVTNLEGRQVISRVSGTSLKLNVTSLSSGVYLLVITKDQKTSVKRFIKAN
ncbi:cadherin domain-containing protein [Ekhidna sp.]|uniref:cadherin domain-containing protein n=1 Tax=Ekhidna sp. TaxID=2608089 RepID=UPI003BADA919